jgi:glycosyltransferase involved in cell wall biosynthesis
MTDLRCTRVAWISPQLSYLVASTRYRSYYPALALREFEIESVFFSSSNEVVPHLEELDAIVFVKLLDSESLRLAGLAKDQGVKVLVDLCDNVVVANYPMTPDFHPALRLAGIGAFVDAIVVPSPALIETLKPLLRSGVRFVVIPDQIETKESFAAAEQLQELVAMSTETRPLTIAQRASRFIFYMLRDPVSATAVLKSKIALVYRLTGLRLATFNRTPVSCGGANFRAASGSDLARVGVNDAPQVRPKSVLWFGNFGAPHSDFGMLALMLAGPALEAVYNDIPLELTVISNKKVLFDEAISQIEVPTRYVDWSNDAVFDALKKADVCLLPFGIDAFSVTKSANRAVLALECGVPVVTTRLLSMEPLEGVVAFDDWEAGLRRFLGPVGAVERDAAIAAARPILAETYSAAAIGKAWANLIDDAPSRPRPGYVEAPSAGEIAVLLESPESIELLLPLIDVIRQRDDVLLRVLVTPNALAASVRGMIERQIIPYALDAETMLAGDDRIMRTVDCLLTAGEHRSDPDSLAASVTRIALARGITTFALNANVDSASVTARSLSSMSGAPIVLRAPTAGGFIEELLNGPMQARTKKHPSATPARRSADNVLDVSEMPLANQSQ